MSRRTPIAVAGAENDAPTYRYWGKTKPPKNAAILCAVSPRLAADDPTKATLRIFGPIDSWGGYWGTSAKDVAQALDELGQDVKEIQLRVNSGGGSVFEGIAILNLLRAHPANVTAVVDGWACSAASVIVAGCDTRIMSPGTQMMIHDPWSSAWGCNAAEMRKAAATLDKIGQGLADLYADVAGGTSAAWRALMVEETWYTAAEAVTAGLADEVAVVANLGATATAGDEEPDPLEDDDFLDLIDLSIFNHAGRDAAPAPKPPSASAVGSPITEGGSAVALSNEQITMRQKLGIAEDADDATVLAALDEALEERIDPPANPAPANAVPEGHVVVQEAELATLRAGANAGAQAQRTLQDRDREAFLDANRTKFPTELRAAWAKQYDLDPVATATAMAAAPVLIPANEIGHGADTEDTSTEVLDDVRKSDAYKNWSI